MITTRRISIKPSTKEYPYKAPEKVILHAKELAEKYHKYSIDDQMMLMLVPIESEAYKEIDNLISLYPEYFKGLKGRFERKYSKEEILSAKAFRMEVESIFNGYCDDTKYHTYSCEKCKFYDEQFKDYEIPPKEWKNRDLSFSDYYTFYVSPNLKKEIERIEATNVKFRPAWSRKDKVTPIAYQIEVCKYLPPLSMYNSWEICKTCSNCSKLIYDPNYKNPIYMPNDILENLKDFNATSEVFTELSSREYIVSRRIYELFKKYGVKKMNFEPVFAFENE